ncbi:MAG: DUF58 domain-containing protein [Candidatus Accumulibacter sp.]|jgi:uncharacterized protein (DUF58 family)|nr:DUF58 domain-containing protein [Accumulibacter sp.]
MSTNETRNNSPGQPRSVLRPTRAGICWLAAVLALLATAINYSNNLIFAMAFVMLSLWLQSAWLCRRNLRGLRWHPAAPVPVFAGERIGVGGALAETAGVRRYALRLCVGGEASLAADLAPGSDARLEAAVAAPRRGVQRLDPLMLASTYPSGLWRQRVVLPAMEALVYPAPAGEAPLPVAAPVPAHRRFAADNFQGVRRYAPGDPTRRINWRVYGRSGQLVVNQFDGAQGGEALWLRWEQTQGDAETRLSQLAAWILAAQRDGLEYGLQLGHLRLAPRRGADHQAACLSALARFDAADAADAVSHEAAAA